MELVPNNWYSFHFRKFYVLNNFSFILSGNCSCFGTTSRYEKRLLRQFFGRCASQNNRVVPESYLLPDARFGRHRNIPVTTLSRNRQTGFYCLNNYIAYDFLFFIHRGRKFCIEQQIG